MLFFLVSFFCSALALPLLRCIEKVFIKTRRWKMKEASKREMFSLYSPLARRRQLHWIQFINNFLLQNVSAFFRSRVQPHCITKMIDGYKLWKSSVKINAAKKILTHQLQSCDTQTKKTSFFLEKRKTWCNRCPWYWRRIYQQIHRHGS